MGHQSGIVEIGDVTGNDLYERSPIMMRTLMLAIATLTLCTAPIGCGDEMSEAVDEMGIKQGLRPVPETPRPPPGPPQGGTNVAQEEGTPGQRREDPQGP